MITKTGKGKAVLVKVFEEKPRQRKSLLSSSKDPHDDQHQQVHHHHHHHHHYVHHDIKQEITVHKEGGSCDATNASGKGNSTKAQLRLLQSQNPQPGSAQQAKTSFFQPKQPSPPNNNQQPAKTIVSAQKKPKRSTATAPGNWKKLLLSNFCRSSKSVQVKKSTKKKNQNTGPTSNPIQAAMNSMKVQKKKGFFAKLVPKTKKA